MLPEVVLSLTLLNLKFPYIMQETNVVCVLAVLLDHLDKFNQMAPGKAQDEAVELSWPGLQSK